MVSRQSRKGRKSGAGRAGRKARSSAPSPFASERELVFMAEPGAGLRATGTDVASVGGADVSSLSKLIKSKKVMIRPLFRVSEERLQVEAMAMADATGKEVPNLSVFYKVEAPDARLDELADQLREQDVVQTAFVKPPSEPPFWPAEAKSIPDEPPVITPDFTSRQGYLNAAPGGIDARFAWTQPGGFGDGIKIIDIEGAWRFSHEDLLLNQGGVVGGTPRPELNWRNHGTAVIGEFGGDRNQRGVTGICPDANVRAISFGGIGSAAAIRQAANMLGPGDIILIELHRAGPRNNFEPRADQRGYIAIEWWPDDFDAIRFATSRGVIVVEAAGNGAENLDSSIYNTNPSPPNGPFPSWWHNPFRRNPLDSGAIVVGAGAPPPGTHGNSHGPDRSRLDFSNFGALVDAQGWGREVTTTGGRSSSAGDLQGGVSEDLWYTDSFSGTSSASPIVVGALGCVQGVLRAQSRPRLTPTRARRLLRSTGSAQQSAPGRPASQRIGNRPNLRKLIPRALGTTDGLTAQPEVVNTFEEALSAPNFGNCAREHYEVETISPISCSGEFIAYASPDSTYAITKKFFDEAQESILIGIYDYTADYMKDLLLRAMQRGVKASLMLDMDDRTGETEIFDELLERGCECVPAPSCNGRRAHYFALSHEKVIVIDKKLTLVQSGNFTDNSIPPNEADGAGSGHFFPGNRDMGLAIRSVPLARFFDRILRSDMRLETDAPPDLIDVTDVPAEPEIELFAEAPPDVPPQRFRSKKLNPQNAVRVLPVLSPDNYMKVIPRFLASATSSIYIEQQYIRSWQENILVLLGAIRQAMDANSNLDVRIILAPPKGSDDRQKIDRAVNELKNNFGLKLNKNVRFLNPRYFVHCHNKLIVVDEKSVLVSSQNWSHQAVTFNREAGLLLTYPALARYYADIFKADWETGLKSLPAVAPPDFFAPEAFGTGKVVRLNLGDYADV